MDADKPKEFSVSTELQWKMRKIIFDIFYSEKTAWFFLGMATEAVGIAVPDMMGWPYYPTIDFLIGVIIGMFLLWYQKRYPRVVYEKEDEDDALESEDQVAG